MWGHPVWLVGFRPFFTLAFISGAVLPLVWAGVYWGRIALPPSGLAPFQWHAFEMLYGFGWAVLGGFLLTASKNWVKIRGLHGGPLALAALLWIAERGAILLPAEGAVGLARLALLNAFGAYVIGYLVWTLVRFRGQDAFPDNVYFVLGLPVFMVARNLMLWPETWAVGMTLSIGIFRLAFTVMFERTITQFMQTAMKTTLPRHRFLDLPVKALVLLAAFEALLPPPVAAAVLAGAAAFHLARWLTWKPLKGLATFSIGVMYVGYLALIAHLAVSAAHYAGLFPAARSFSIHIFTFLCMGIVIPSMLVRICQGHTGRKLLFTASDRVAITAVGVGGFFRLVATQLWPAQYATWIALAAACWSLCFLMLGVRLTPFLWKPRIDAREH